LCYKLIFISISLIQHLGASTEVKISLNIHSFSIEAQKRLLRHMSL